MGKKVTNTLIKKREEQIKDHTDTILVYTMTSYTDETAEDGFHEQYMGFFWSDDTDEGPQYFTIQFKLSEEMEADFPGAEVEEKHGIEELETRREQWVADHIDTLLRFDFVIDVYSHDEINSVDALEDALHRMDFDAFYY